VSLVVEKNWDDDDNPTIRCYPRGGHVFTLSLSEVMAQIEGREFALHLCPRPNVDITVGDTIYEPYILEFSKDPLFEGEYSLIVTRDHTTVAEVNEFPSQVRLMAGNYTIKYDITCTNSGYTFHESKEVASFRVEKDPMEVNIAYDKYPFYFAQTQYAVSIEDNTLHRRYVGTITWPDGSVEEVDFSSETYSRSKDIAFSSSEPREFRLHVCWADVPDYCVDKKITVTPRAIIPSLSVSLDKDTSYIGEPVVEQVTASITLPDGSPALTWNYALEVIDSGGNSIYSTTLPNGQEAVTFSLPEEVRNKLKSSAGTYRFKVKVYASEASEDCSKETVSSWFGKKEGVIIKPS